MSELSPSLQQALDPEARERYDRQRQRNAWDSLASKPVHVGVDLAEEGQDATLLVVEPDGFYSNAVAQRIKQEDAQWTGGSATPCAEAQAAAERQAQAVQNVHASKKELLFSPQGLRGLFPTNLVSTKLVRRR